MTDQPFKLVVGLGNPGPRYASNRHNIGFIVLEALARHLKLDFVAGGPTYQWASGPGFALLKPMTFMNLSGEAVLAWADDHGRDIAPLVVCDDLALPLGSVRLRGKGSAGGQNGLLSVIESLNSEEFPRLRMGIAPLTFDLAPVDWPNYVLSDFEADEQKQVVDQVNHAVAALAYWLDNDLERTASRYNRRIRPVDPEAEAD